MAHNSDYTKVYTTATEGLSLGEVARAVYENADMGKVCTSEHINKWAKYKPIDIEYKGVLSESQRKGAYYGLYVPYYTNLLDMARDMVAGTHQRAANYDASKTPWTYYKPSGDAMRLLDFDGYYHNAEGFGSVYTDLVEVLGFVPFNLISSLGAYDEGSLRGSDFLPIDSGYMGVMTAYGSATAPKFSAVAIKSASVTTDSITDYEPFNIRRDTTSGGLSSFYACTILSRNRMELTHENTSGHFVPVIPSRNLITVETEPMTVTGHFDSIMPFDRNSGLSHGDVVTFMWYMNCNGRFGLNGMELLVAGGDWARVSIPDFTWYPSSEMTPCIKLKVTVGNPSAALEIEGYDNPISCTVVSGGCLTDASSFVGDLWFGGSADYEGASIMFDISYNS